jgi:hypothetical protein
MDHPVRTLLYELFLEPFRRRLRKDRLDQVSMPQQRKTL